ncbi:MAG TPA: efflux RND transporter periplasmic adaptor subunit [Candidatus Acidoferrum sp.]|nr:efflux RND transporter periplasmic adaptor subunit [Candidatus Acidoferrum sp.]
MPVIREIKVKWPCAQAVALLVTAVSLSACDKAEQQQAAPPAPPAVTVAKVASTEITPSSTFTGRIEAVDKVDLRARVQGFIEKRLFEEGADVKEGDLLFTLDKAPFEAEIDRINADIAGAEAALQVATLSYQRQATLVKKEVAAVAVLDQVTAKQLEAKAQLQSQQAALEKAKLDLGYTDIRSPMAGRIGKATYSVGDLVGPESGTLATVVSQDPIYVTFPVSQRDLLAVRKQAEAEGTDARAVRVKVRLADGSIYDQAGSINFVDVTVSTTTDTVAIRAQLPNPKRLLIDGQLVTAVVEAAKPKTALVIPTPALQIDQTGRFVLVVGADNKVEVRRIEIDRGYEGNLVVTKGLKEGERVITIGAQKVRPQQVVEPTEVSAEAPAS